MAAAQLSMTLQCAPVSRLTRGTSGSSSLRAAPRVAGVPALRVSATRGHAICRAKISEGESETVSRGSASNGSVSFEQSGFMEKAMLMVAASATSLFLLPEASLAKDGEFGLWEGRSFALLHPAVMFTLFATSLYAAYTGWQWRRIREIGTQISVVKKTVPEGEAGASSPAAAEVAKLTKERKSLTEGGFRDKHWVTGSFLLAGGVGIAVEGCVNTYLRTGRLFPGPHLYAGAAIAVLWAAAAALVPAMQKGNDTARTAHIALNVANVLLFAWQIPTGLDIVWKVFEFTSWP